MTGGGALRLQECIIGQNNGGVELAKGRGAIWKEMVHRTGGEEIWHG